MTNREAHNDWTEADEARVIRKGTACNAAGTCYLPVDHDGEHNPPLRYAVRYNAETGNYDVTFDGWVASFRDEPDAHQYVTDHERRGY